KKRAADQSRLRAERHRFQDILSRTNSAVEVNLRPAADRINYLRQNADRRRRAVQLPSAVVGDDDGVGAVVDGLPRVFGIEHALDDDPDAKPLFDPADVLPGERRIELRIRPCGELTEIVYVLHMAHEIAEGAPLRAQHAERPS